MSHNSFFVGTDRLNKLFILQILFRICRQSVILALRLMAKRAEEPASRYVFVRDQVFSTRRGLRC